jgi:hypothetical protein
MVSFVHLCGDVCCMGEIVVVVVGMVVDCIRLTGLM